MRDREQVPTEPRADAARPVHPSSLSSAQRAAMQGLERDRQTAVACRYLRDAGVSVLLLKGPAIGRWLWGDVPRPYSDADLLVDPTQFADAEAILIRHGYTPPIFAEPGQSAVPYHAPDPDYISVDLHRSFRLVGVSPERCWSLLAADAQGLKLLGGEVATPSYAGLAVIVALHAIWHGVDAPRASEDVRRAVARLDIAGWRAAKELAAALGCLDAFTAGLHTVSDGRELAGRIGLAPVSRPEFRVRLGGRPPTSLAWIDVFATRRSPREILSLLLHELVPSAGSMRLYFPYARKSPPTLVASYLLRLVRLAADAPRAILEASRALKNRDDEWRRRL